jgi:hypothetical protein
MGRSVRKKKHEDHESRFGGSSEGSDAFHSMRQRVYLIGACSNREYSRRDKLHAINARLNAAHESLEATFVLRIHHKAEVRCSGVGTMCDPREFHRESRITSHLDGLVQASRNTNQQGNAGARLDKAWRTSGRQHYAAS